MKIYYADHFVLPLPAGHRFPMQKYALLRERIAACLPAAALLVPEAATDGELLRVHTADYLHRVVTGTLDPAEVRRIGFPWSAAMVERSRRSVGATIAASRAALSDGAGANLAGGTHHAFSDHGEGFCVFNDVAVAFRAMQAEGRARRCAIIDCDVHQGNGTAAIFDGDGNAFTFSVHGGNNFPFRKVSGSLDIALPDGAGDDEYLDAVRRGVNAAMDTAPDIVYYVAGADPYEGDRLGRLSVSMEGLRERDRIVTAACRDSGVPLALVMGGGYGGVVEETVAIHAGSVMEVSRLVPRP
ncbi:MAG TPA: histone deacetylase [Longimicrobiales bacterium]|nr:histone deacetylase [Longimicrobiales bacterium]